MKKHIKQTPTYVFIIAAVLGSWGIAFAKTIIASSYPQISGTKLQLLELQYQYIFAFLF